MDIEVTQAVLHDAIFEAVRKVWVCSLRLNVRNFTKRAETLFVIKKKKKYVV